MDNIIWIILAAAVMLALAGTLLFLSSNTLDDISSGTEDIMNTPDDPAEASDWEKPDSGLDKIEFSRRISETGEMI